MTVSKMYNSAPTPGDLALRCVSFMILVSVFVWQSIEHLNLKYENAACLAVIENVITDRESIVLELDSLISIYRGPYKEGGE